MTPFEAQWQCHLEMFPVWAKLKFCCLVKGYKSELFVNSLQNGKILDLPKFKAFAENKSNVTQKLNFFWEG